MNKNIEVILEDTEDMEECLRFSLQNINGEHLVLVYKGSDEEEFIGYFDYGEFADMMKFFAKNKSRVTN